MPGLDGRPLEDATLATYLAELHDQGLASPIRAPAGQLPRVRGRTSRACPAGVSDDAAVVLERAVAREPDR